jgi:hypothetical protein
VRGIPDQALDRGIEVAMLDLELDQSLLQRHSLRVADAFDVVVVLAD